MINDKQSRELTASVNDVVESMNIVTDSMLTLDDKSGVLAKTTTDLTAAYDINSDSSIQVAQEQEKLATQLKKSRKNIKARDKSEGGFDEERRRYLSDILNRQQPLVDHTSPESPNTVPEDTRETLEEFIKREIGTKDEFIEEFKKENGKTGKFIRDVASKANIVGRMKNSETSATAKILGHTMSAGVGMITGTINDILSTIPGFQQVSNASKFVGGAVLDAHNARKEKNLDERASKAYSEKKADAVSKFKQIPTNSGSPEEKVKEERENANKKKDRDENKQERDKSEKRFGGLMKWLKAFQMSMIFSKLLGFLLPIGGILMSLAGSIPALMATLGGLAGAIGLAISGAMTKFLDLAKGLFGIKKPTGTPKTSSPDPKKTTKTPTSTSPDVNGKKQPTPSTTQPKPSGPADKIPKDAGKTLGKEAAKDVAGKKLGRKGAEIAGESVFKRVASSGAVKVAAKVGLRMIPFVGTALTLYEIGSYLAENPDVVDKGKAMLSEGASAVGNFFGFGEAQASESKIEPVIRSGEDKAQSQRIEESNKKVEEYRKKVNAEKEEMASRRMGAEYAALHNTTYNAMSSVLPSGFGPYNAEQPIGSYGVQPLS